MDHVRRKLPTCPHCTGVSVGRHAELFVPETERSTWSPWLSVTAEATETGTRVRGRFAPHPHVWTLYMFCVFALGFALFVGLSLGYAQYSLGLRPWALMAIPICGALGAALYMASLIGQRLSAHQMEDLHAALDELLSDLPTGDPEPGP
jgi:hypothetical protein